MCDHWERKHTRVWIVTAHSHSQKPLIVHTVRSECKNKKKGAPPLKLGVVSQGVGRTGTRFHVATVRHEKRFTGGILEYDFSPPTVNVQNASTFPQRKGK